MAASPPEFAPASSTAGSSVLQENEKHSGDSSVTTSASRLDNGGRAEERSGNASTTFTRAPRLNASITDFNYTKLLGMGSYSKVVLATFKEDGKEYALKIMAKQLILRERKTKSVKRERMILDQLDHPGIVRMCFTFQDATSLYMGMECCHGGDLFEQILARKPFPVNDARFYTAEIVCILEYLHSRGVVHRDLKPENLLLAAEGHLKLADFGSATVVRDNQTIEAGKAEVEGVSPVQLPEDSDPWEERTGSFVGTADYISPEALQSQTVSFESDLWALGCILFQMLEGRPPFRGKSEYLTFQRVLARDFSFNMDTTQSEARDLIERLLQVDPSSRLGSRAAGGFAALKQHPFFKGIDWSTCLWDHSAPSLVRVQGSSSSEAEDGESEEDEGEDEGETESGSGSEDDEWKVAHLNGDLMKLKC